MHPTVLQALFRICQSVSTMAFRFEELPPSECSDADLLHCAELFSSHYGVWAQHPSLPKELRAGAHVRLSGSRLRQEHLFSEQCRLVRALTADGTRKLVGQAFVCRFDVPEKGTVSWITQLVVHADYRRRGIAKRLCRIAWAVDNFYAAGLVSSHPYAVRAVECATERTCDPKLISKAAAEIILHSQIEYTQGKEMIFDNGRCLLNTEFFVDHTQPNEFLANIPDWHLGELLDGMEFIGLTFAESPKTVKGSHRPSRV